MKFNDVVSRGKLPKPEVVLLSCGKHKGVRGINEPNVCYKCKPKKHVKWQYKGNYALNTKTSVPSKRSVKDNAKRGLDSFANIRS